MCFYGEHQEQLLALFKSIEIRSIVFTIFILILTKTEFHFVLNQSENGKYNQISIDLSSIKS